VRGGFGELGLVFTGQRQTGFGELGLVLPGQTSFETLVWFFENMLGLISLVWFLVDRLVVFFFYF